MNLLELPSYDPNVLLDIVSSRLHCKNDAELAAVLSTYPPVISKFRHKKLPIGSRALIEMHLATDIPIFELKRLMGVK